MADPSALIVSLGSMVGNTALTEATKQTVKAFFGWLKDKLSKDKDKDVEALIAKKIEEFQQIEEAKLALLAEAVKKLYEEDQDFREEFEKRVKELEKKKIIEQSVEQGKVIINVKGDKNIIQSGQNIEGDLNITIN